MSTSSLIIPVQQSKSRVEYTMGTGRNSEKRRERSKVAARDRRSKESEIFSELSQYLPLPESTRNSLDKASVMRLSLSDLKLRSMVEKVIFRTDTSKSTRTFGHNNDLEADLGTLLNNAMGGFLLVLSTEGDMIYVSESVTAHLGLSQVEVMGLNIYDFSHPCDHADIKELLFVNKKGAEEKIGKRSGSFRMKCTITERGRNVHIRAATYKLIDFTGRMLPSTGEDDTDRWFVGVGEPLLHPSDVDIPLNKQTFLTKHSPDMKCEFVDDSIATFLGYCPEDLIGRSIFEFHHASDGPALSKAFKALYVKGQSVTERYRFLAKHGGWIWVVTQATLIQSNSGMKPNSIVCLNFITSGIENEDEIVSAIQREPISRPFGVITPNFKNLSAVSSNASKEDLIERKQKENISPHAIPANKPIPSTTKIFAPRTEDMDSGFLMPCDDRLIVSKEEPEDLTHLAPIAGDESVPLVLPLLDDLLKSLANANMEYTLSNFVIDVNADELPPLEEFPTSSPMTDPDERECCGESSLIGSSPLFLSSDPHMVSSPGSKSSLLSPFQQQLSPTSSRSNESNSYTCSSSMSPDDLEQSPYSLEGGESTSISVPALVSMSLQELDRRWAINPGGTGSTHSPRDLNFSPEEEMSNCNLPIPTTINLLPVNDTGEYMVLGHQSSSSVVNTTELLVPHNFNVSDGNLARKQMCETEARLFPFDNGTSTNSKKVDLHSECCSNSFENFSKSLRTPNEQVRKYEMELTNPMLRNWDPTVSQKRPHQVFIKSEVPPDNIFDCTSSSEPRVAKQPKLTGSTSTPCTGTTSTNNIPRSTTLPFAVDEISAKKVSCTQKETNADVFVPLVVLSSNDRTNSQSPGPPESEKCVTEIDLKAYIQNLLSSGRNDIINALFKELSSYRKECNLCETDANTSTTIITNNSEKSGRLKSSVLPVDTSQSPNSKCDSQNSSLIAVVGLCGDTTKALVELTTLDCEVNAPANEGSNQLHASDLVKDLDEDNFM